MPTRPVDREKAEGELSLHIKKATSAEETSPKQKHVRSKYSSQSTRFNVCTNPPHHRRVYRVHMGLSFIAVGVERTASSTHPK